MPDKNLQLDKFVGVFPDLFMLRNRCFWCRKPRFWQDWLWASFLWDDKVLKSAQLLPIIVFEHSGKWWFYRIVIWKRKRKNV